MTEKLCDENSNNIEHDIDQIHHKSNIVYIVIDDAYETFQQTLMLGIPFNFHCISKKINFLFQEELTGVTDQLDNTVLHRPQGQLFCWF